MVVANMIYTGIVEENNDPRRLGRVKIRILGIFDNIPTRHIPWAFPSISPAGASIHIPPIGKSLNVYFDNGCIYSPMYDSTDFYNKNLQNKLNSLTTEQYNNFYAISYDDQTRIYYQDEDLYIQNHLNRIKMTKDNIDIEIKSNGGKINLGSNDSDQRVVLGDHFIMDWMKEFCRILINPVSLVGNMSVPIIKTELDLHLNKFLAMPSKFVSKNVYVVDNNKVKDIKDDIKTTDVYHDTTNIVSPILDNPKGVIMKDSEEFDKDSRKRMK